MDENKKKGGFFGKLIKGFGLFLLVIVAVVGAGAAGAWMTGRFDPEKIYIQTLTINGVKEYVTITENDTSYTTKVDYAPAEANQLTLTAKIVTGGSLIEPLGNVVAGQPLELKFIKDENGNVLLDLNSLTPEDFEVIEKNGITTATLVIKDKI
jgi:hypothetical protein